MYQQQNLFTQEMFESPELMEAVIESYLDANPLIKACAQGLIQLIPSFASNFCQQNSTFMNAKNDPNENNKNENEKATEKDVNDNLSQNEKSNVNDNDNDNDIQNSLVNNNEKTKNHNQNNNSNPHVDDIFSFLSQILNGNDFQQLFSSFMPFLQMFQTQQTNQNQQQESESPKEKDQNEENKNNVGVNESLIQDLIMQTLNPEIFESTSIPSENDNEDIEKKDENDMKNQNKIFNFFEMFKVLYQMYVQNKENPDNFVHPLIYSLNNIISQFVPNYQSVFTHKFEDIKLNEFDFSNLFPFAKSYFQMMMNHANEHSNHKNDQDKKHAELKRTKFVDYNGKVKKTTRYTIGEKWYEVENELNSDGEECKTTKETWNNISEESFEDFMNEWKKLFEIQNK